MRELSPEELHSLPSAKGRRISPLGALIRDMEIGQSVLIDTQVDEIKSPLSAYAIAKSVGRKITRKQVDDTTWVITRIQ